MATSNTSTAQLHLCSHLNLNDCYARTKKRKSVLVITLKLNVVVKYLEFLVPHDHIEFQSNRNVKYALNASTTLQPTKKKRKEIHYKVPLPLQSIKYIPV